MPRLIESSPDGEKREHRVGREIATIGRRKQCSIALRDSATSRHHATIELVDGEYVLRDENSGNGTFVNGERVTERVLADGDEIKMGGTRLSFVADPPRPARQPAERRTGPRRKSSRREREELDPEAAKAEARRKEGMVKLVFIAISGVAFVLIVFLFARFAMRRTGDESEPRVVHEDAEARIRSLYNSGMKLLGEENYDEARAKFVECYDLCDSLRKEPKYSGEGFYWLEKKQQDCNTKIRQCGDQIFRRDMRILREKNR